MIYENLLILAQCALSTRKCSLRFALEFVYAAWLYDYMLAQMIGTGEVRLSKPAAPSLVDHLAINTPAESIHRSEVLHLFSSDQTSAEVQGGIVSATAWPRWAIESPAHPSLAAYLPASEV